MPRPKKTVPPTNTSHLFGGRKPNERGAAMTSDRIASDLDAFEKAGGHIEVLGITRSLKKIDADTADAAADAVPATPPAAPASKRR